MEELPSNSHSKKENSIPGASEKIVKKVVSGDVVQQKPSMLTKFKNTFFGGDFSGVARYIGTEVLLPALRNLVVDTATKGVERAIYGDTAPRRRSAGPGVPRFQYDTPLRRDPRRAHLPDQAPHTPRSRGGYDIGDILVASKQDADLVLERMVDIVDQYQIVSVSDMFELLGLPSTYVDNKWGWSDLRYADVRQTRNGYLIDLPPIELIEN
jgi:hypothetical protein